LPAIRLRSWRALLILGIALAAATLAVPHARAWYQLRAARSALARYHPEEAAPLLASCLRAWPDDAQVRLLASRAARQTGDLEEADRHLRICQGLLGGGSREVALEWALLQAVGGNSREVEAFLERRAGQDAGLRPLIWEALIEGHTRVYRILDALALADHWLRIDPDNVRAHELRGLAYQRGKSTSKGTEDLRRAIELDPTRDAARWNLVLGLLEMGSYGDALKHLETIERQRPDDPEVRVRVARCQNLLGDASLARQTLDAVLEAHPDHGLALRTRGQFALADRRPDEAERWLRRAAKVWPNDYQVHWFLYQSLQQQGKEEEAKAQLAVAEKNKERAERVGELRSRTLSERPLDPALHYEMGVLLLRNGNASAAKGWLLSALNLAPDYRPAHAALADLYRSEGDQTRAAEHSLRAAGPTK
jgi:Tfp pilus assembly protein PilF